MANVDIRVGKKDAVFFSANPTLILKDGQFLFNSDTLELFIGDGTSQLSALVAINVPPSSGVQSVTGPQVDNADPNNPIVNPLGLIQIVDLNGELFTDLATATTYIEQFIIPSVITDKSFKEGVFFFTVPNSTAINGYFLIDNITPSITFASLIDRFCLLDLTNAQEFGYMNAGHHILGNGLFQNSAFNLFSGTIEMNSLYIAASGGNFGQSSTGKFIIKGSIGISETANFGANFFLSSTATINANASKYTSNAGGIHGDLQTAIANGCNVQFDGINLATLNSNQTLTNKRVTERVSSITSSATPTPNADTDDLFKLTAQAAAAAFVTPTGTPTDGQTLLIDVSDNGTARALSFDSGYKFSTDQPAPTTTVIGKKTKLGFEYDIDITKWCCLGWIQI